MKKKPFIITLTYKYNFCYFLELLWSYGYQFLFLHAWIDKYSLQKFTDRSGRLISLENGDHMLVVNRKFACLCRLIYFHRDTSQYLSFACININFHLLISEVSSSSSYDEDFYKAFIELECIIVKPNRQINDFIETK